MWGDVSRVINSKTISVGADAFGRPNTNPPTVVDQDNLTLYSFTVNTDRVTYKFPVPFDYDGDPILFYVVWTNDGGTDDLNKWVKWQLDYQTAAEGDVVSGDHANSPKSVEDQYTSNSGWVECHSDVMEIQASDFAGKTCIFLKLMAVTAPDIVLSCEPHLIGLCFTYNAKINY